MGIPNQDCAASFQQPHEPTPNLGLSGRVSFSVSRKTGAGISDEPERDENSTEWMVSERLPNERVVLAEQAAYTIRQSAGQIPEDLERADVNDSESAVDV